MAQALEELRELETDAVAWVASILRLKTPVVVSAPDDLVLALFSPPSASDIPSPARASVLGQLAFVACPDIDPTTGDVYAFLEACAALKMATAQMVPPSILLYYHDRSHAQRRREQDVESAGLSAAVERRKRIWTCVLAFTQAYDAAELRRRRQLVTVGREAATVAQYAEHALDRGDTPAAAVPIGQLPALLCRKASEARDAMRRLVDRLPVTGLFGSLVVAGVTATLAAALDPSDQWSSQQVLRAGQWVVSTETAGGSG